MRHPYRHPARRLIDAIIDRQNLETAWEQVLKKHGAPGLDGVTLLQWARNWDINIERMREQVMTNTYIPSKPKRFFISKRHGGLREISILTVTDRILQRAAVNVLMPIYEERFLSCSHGYRPNRSTTTALQQVINYRDRDYEWVLDADIHDCFYSLDHQILMELVERVIKDWHVLNLIQLWLKAGRKKTHQAIGIPMRAVIAPLLCNIYLHQLDANLCTHHWKIVRYADDFVVMVENESLALAAYDVVDKLLHKLKLTYAEEKTRITNFEEGFSYLGVTFQKEEFFYDFQRKHIHVEGSSPKLLYLYPPQFY